jgi:hypothetical protein
MQSCPPIGARHRSGGGNPITELGHRRFAQPPWRGLTPEVQHPKNAVNVLIKNLPLRALA